MLGFNCSSGAVILFLMSFCFVFETRFPVVQDSLKFTMELDLPPDPPASTSLVLGLEACASRPVILS